jgi:hypothetical protein
MFNSTYMIKHEVGTGGALTDAIPNIDSHWLPGGVEVVTDVHYHAPGIVFSTKIEDLVLILR